MALSIGVGLATPFPRLPRDALPYGVRTFLYPPLARLTATPIIPDDMHLLFSKNSRPMQALQILRMVKLNGKSASSARLMLSTGRHTFEYTLAE